MGDSGEIQFYELDHESKIRLLKTHSHTSNVLAMEPGTREEKQLKETQTLKQSKPPIKNLPRTAGVAGGGAEKALEPAAYRRCGGGGQERLCGKPTTEKVLWRGEPSSIWRGTQALMQGRSHTKTFRGPSAWRGVRRGNDKYPAWKVASPTAPRGGEGFSRKKKENKHNTKKKMTHRTVHSPVPRYARTGYPGRPPVLG